MNSMGSALQTCLAQTVMHFKHLSFTKVMQVSGFHLQGYSKAHYIEKFSIEQNKSKYHSVVYISMQTHTHEWYTLSSTSKVFFFFFLYIYVYISKACLVHSWMQSRSKLKHYGWNLLTWKPRVEHLNITYNNYSFTVSNFPVWTICGHIDSLETKYKLNWWGTENLTAPSLSKGRQVIQSYNTYPSLTHDDVESTSKLWLKCTWNKYKMFCFFSEIQICFSQTFIFIQIKFGLNLIFSDKK